MHVLCMKLQVAWSRLNNKHTYRIKIKTKTCKIVSAMWHEDHDQGWITVFFQLGCHKGVK